MIKRLRRRFIRIAALSVALVLLLLTLVVNAAYFISTDSDLTRTLELICENAGTIPVRSAPAAPDDASIPDDTAAPESTDGERPSPPEQPWDGKDGPFTQETPFSTRFFVLRYTDGGALVRADLDNIAAVTEDDVDEYLSVALRGGEGFGYYGHYKYYVVSDGEGRQMAVFLDCFQQLRSAKSLALWSLAADGACIALVYLLIVALSRRAIDPVVRSAEQQKQFITDASHELKTPLTVITTCLTLLKMDPSETKWVDKAEAQTKKMSELVASLVTLSRMDEEEPPMTNTTFDLSEAVSDTAESFRDSAASGGHAFALSITPGIEYHGDEGALRQLTSILLDNALRYSLTGGDIALSLTREKRNIVLRQSNPCAPLTDDELSRLFDRFYRPDASRTAATGGFGVGLSIARGIAQAHGGTIRATCPEPGRIEFTLTLKI